MQCWVTMPTKRTSPAGTAESISHSHVCCLVHVGGGPGLDSETWVLCLSRHAGCPIQARGPQCARCSRTGMEAWGGSPVLAGVGKFLEMDRWPRFAPRFAPRFWALTWVALVFGSNASRSGGDDFRWSSRSGESCDIHLKHDFRIMLRTFDSGH